MKLAWMLVLLFSWIFFASLIVVEKNIGNKFWQVEKNAKTEKNTISLCITTQLV